MPWFRPFLRLCVAFGLIASITVPAFAVQMSYKDGSGKGKKLDSGESSQNGAALEGQQQNQDTAGKSAQIGQALMAAGAAMMAACCGKPGAQACCAMGQTLMGMGAMAMAQSGANDKTAKNHGFNSKLNQGYASETDGYEDGSDPGSSADKVDVRSPDLAKIATMNAMKSLEKHGAKYDPNTHTLTYSDGKALNLSSLSDPGARAAAGLSDSSYKAIMDKVKAEEKKADKTSLASFSNGADTGSGGLPPLPSVEETPAASGGEGFRKPASSVAGMSRNYGGAKIGVAGDDIFAMMTRRYREKVSKDAFLPPEATP